jgi:hypothetical protein
MASADWLFSFSGRGMFSTTTARAGKRTARLDIETGFHGAMVPLA